MIYVHTRARSYNPVWRRHYILLYSRVSRTRAKKCARRRCDLSFWTYHTIIVQYTIIVMNGVVVEAVMMMILPRRLFTRLRKTDCISWNACIINVLSREKLSGRYCYSYSTGRRYKLLIIHVNAKSDVV